MNHELLFFVWANTFLRNSTKIHHKSFPLFFSPSSYTSKSIFLILIIHITKIQTYQQSILQKMITAKQYNLRFVSSQVFSVFCLGGHVWDFLLLQWSPSSFPPSVKKWQMQHNSRNNGLLFFKYLVIKKLLGLCVWISYRRYNSSSFVVRGTNLLKQAAYIMQEKGNNTVLQKNITFQTGIFTNTL